MSQLGNPQADLTPSYLTVRSATIEAAPEKAATSLQGLTKSTPATAKKQGASMATPKPKPDLRPDDPRHGTNPGYNLGCRLDCCRHAHMVWMKRYRLYGATATVPARRFDRRVRALQAIGWTTRQISDQMGRSKSFVTATLGQQRVRTETLDSLIETYDRLCMTVPTGWVAERARRNAKLAGYTPPLGWDDIDNDPSPAGAVAEEDPVDEIKVERVTNGWLEDCNTAERYAVIERWDGSLAELERITGWNIHRLINKKKVA